MKRIFAPFTRNWWLKLIALILALAVFYGVRSSLHGNQYGMQTRIFAPAPAPKVKVNADTAR